MPTTIDEFKQGARFGSEWPIGSGKKWNAPTFQGMNSVYQTVVNSENKVNQSLADIEQTVKTTESTIEVLAPNATAVFTVTPNFTQKKTTYNIKIPRGVGITNIQFVRVLTNGNYEYRITLNDTTSYLFEAPVGPSGAGVENLLDRVYPVGSIYMSANNVSPASFIGGTWVAWGAGRVPLGMGSNGETNYTTPEQTGGSENSVAPHNHTQNSHNHTQNSHNHTQNSHMHNMTVRVNGTQFSREQVQVTSTNNNNDYFRTDIRVTGGSVNVSDWWNARDRMFVSNATATNNATTATNNATTPINNSTGSSGGNRMPFITCYMWKRTA